MKKKLILILLMFLITDKVNAVDFNEKFYGKMVVKIGYNTQFITDKGKDIETKYYRDEWYTQYKDGMLKNLPIYPDSKGLKTFSNGVNASVGFDVFYKMTDIVHPFTGIELVGSYNINSEFIKDHKFNSVFNVNALFGTTLKINDSLKIRPYGLVGFNVSSYKGLSAKEYAFGKNILELNGAKDPTSLIHGTSYSIIYEPSNLFKNYVKWNNSSKVLDFYTNAKLEMVAKDNKINIIHIDSLEDLKSKVKNYKEIGLFKYGDEFGYFDLSKIDIEKDINLTNTKMILYDEEYNKLIHDYIGAKNVYKVGLNAGMGIDLVIDDFYIVGLEYRYSQINFDYLKVKTHNTSLKFGIQFL